VTLAKRLLGQRLVRVMDNGERVAGLIVETEAYLGVEDKAAHSVGGRRTARTTPMFAQAGTAYIFLVYGMHRCFNVVCGGIDEPVAVLIRALEPVEGIDRIEGSRAGGSRGGSRRPLRPTDLCNGPGKLCQALSIDATLNAVDMAGDGRIFIEWATIGPIPDENLVNTPRIGVDYAQEWAGRPLRWYIRGNPHVSGLRAGGGG
jgi:DNA-3-methyladenine glycosylase